MFINCLVIVNLKHKVKSAGQKRAVFIIYLIIYRYKDSLHPDLIKLSGAYFAR